MKKHKTITEEITRPGACIELVCDRCGRQAEIPENQLFEWGGAGSCHTVFESAYDIDGESWRESVDLCPDCAVDVMKFAHKTVSKDDKE